MLAEAGGGAPRPAARGRGSLGCMPAWLRWLISALMGVGVSFLMVVFVMSTFRDTSGFITVLKAIPTAFTPTAEGDCEALLESGADPVRIGGTVGTRRAGVFQPLPGVEIVERSKRGEELLGRSGPHGVFEVEARFRWDQLVHCGKPAPRSNEGSKSVIFRAPGCTPRNVPVTRNWIPHRVLLECAEPPAARG